MRSFYVAIFAAVGLGGCQPQSMVALYEPADARPVAVISPMNQAVPRIPAPAVRSVPGIASPGGLNTRYASPDGDVPRFHRALTACQRQLGPREAGLAHNSARLAAAIASSDLSQDVVRIEIPGPATKLGLQATLDRCMAAKGFVPLDD